jgi:hypothetical protein
VVPPGKTENAREAQIMIDNLRKYSALTLCSALLLGVPPVINGGQFLSFDQAQAAKGGNGNGKGGGAGGGKSSNAGGQSAGKSSNAGGQGAGKSSKAGGKSSATQTASVDKKGGGSLKSKKSAGEQKASATSKGSKGAAKKTEVAVTEDAAPSKKSALGRWNAVKPIDHPAVQAHIKNGNFNGTIGLNAAYVLAQDTYNKVQEAEAIKAEAEAEAEAYDKAYAEADATAKQALTNYNLNNGEAADFATIEDYQKAVDAKTIAPVAAIDDAIAKRDSLTPPDPEKLAEAEAVLTENDPATALKSLEDAEAAMAAASNKGNWADIRGDVRAKMGLPADEDDVAAAKAAAEAAAAEAAAAEEAAKTPEVTETPTPTQPTETTETSDETPLLEETASAQ